MKRFLDWLVRRRNPGAGHIEPPALLPRVMRKPAPPDKHGWREHDGGECPVPPDTLVEFPAGTYATFNGRGTMGPCRAGDTEWRSSHIGHLRNEINHYRIMTEAEASEARAERKRRMGQ